MLRNIVSLSGLVAVGIAAGFASPPAHGVDAAATSADSTYQKERADCEAGRTAEDRTTCLKEAGAAQQERKRNRLDNNGSLRQNAIERCNLSRRDKADCLARIEGPNQPNQTTKTAAAPFTARAASRSTATLERTSGTRSRSTSSSCTLIGAPR